MNIINSNEIKNCYESKDLIRHYENAVARVGLWVSEEKIFNKLFNQNQSLLELGCGAGRISIGLWELGYRYLLGVDFSKGMIQAARRINKVLEYGVHFHTEDAKKLSFDDNVFDGVIFGFNGIMQIPGADNRQKALEEIFRVLRPDSYAVFTTHERGLSKYKNFWKKESLLWRKNKQDSRLIDYGDRFEDTKLGPSYVHVPAKEEMIEAIKKAGFRLEVDFLRSSIAQETLAVREFSDECRFWVVQKKM